MPRGFKIADAYAEIHVDTDELRRGASKIPGELGPEMDRAGKGMGQRLGKSLGDESKRQGDDAGGKLAVGMRMSIIRNSPLIVAAVGAALAVGAPALMAGAVGLFAGIGIVAAAQSEKVQSAWLGTWQQIKTGTISAASAIEPVLVKVAGNVGAAFERMQPQLTAAFSAAAPQIEVFADGILALAENALPGLVRAVEAGMPVTRGLADFLAKVGTGLSDFFDRISAHGPAAGSVFSSLGDVMGDLLPILGELLGQGAELAATVLPLLSGSLGIVNSVLQTLGPILPVVAAGFLGFKGALMGLDAASKVGNFLRDLPGKFGDLASRITPVNAVTGALGITVALLAAAHQQSEQRIQSWTAALNEGGQAASKARAEMEEHDAQVRHATSGFLGFATSLTLAAGPLAEMSNETDAAKQANADYLASLTPLETAQRNLGIAEDAVADAVRDHGAGSDEAAAASDRYKAAQAEVERQAGLVEQAIQGVTQAMIDQANQAMGAINADFAYQDALDGLEDKQRALADAIRDHGAASEEASDAQRTYAEGIWDTAQKAAAASPILDGLKEGTAEYDRAVQNLTLQSLVDMRAGLGPEMQAAVDQMIAALQAGGASLDELGTKNPTPTVDANIDPLTGKTQTSFNLLDVLGAQTPTPTANLNPVPLNGVIASVHNSLAILNGQRPTPVASLVDYSTARAQQIIDTLARIQSKTVTVTTNHVINTINNQVAFRQLGGATGGQVGDIRRVGFSSGGRLSGPGSSTSDSIPVRTLSGRELAFSDDEWVIRALAANKYGDRLMAAVNAGTATITAPGAPQVRGFADGGSLDRSGGRTTGGVTIHGGVTLQIPGAFNLGSGIERKRFIAEVRDGLLNLERSER